jgi:hypothetical protein
VGRIFKVTCIVPVTLITLNVDKSVPTINDRKTSLDSSSRKNVALDEEEKMEEKHLLPEHQDGKDALMV